MENEIKVGEYVRSLVNGNISRVLEISDLLEEPNVKYYKTGTFTGFCSTELYNVKHSPNLIDLIQCGDYVNGILVTGKESTLLWTEIKGIDRSGYHIPISQYGENIKSIVTKEQFESISYKVTKM